MTDIGIYLCYNNIISVFDAQVEVHPNFLFKHVVYS